MRGVVGPMKKLLLALVLLLLAALAGCAGQIMDGPGMVNSYRQIDQETAKQMMAKDDGHVVVDVRREDEYAAGHIPGAILIPNESIGTERPEELPDPDQIILIYCRSGNRSKQAAQKLFDMGYTNVYEFGGINTWTGDIAAEEESVMKNTPAVLSFDSFDGGGPEYTVEIDDATVVSFTEERVYASPRHEELDGAGYSVVFTFTGLKPGETQVSIFGWSPIAGSELDIYVLTVDENLNAAARLLTREDPDAIRPTPVLVIEINGEWFCANLEDNCAARLFIEQLEPAEIEVEMRDRGGFEKTGPLPWTLPGNDKEITAEPGDVLLYDGDRIAICYGLTTGELTRLARMGSVTKEALLEAFGDGGVTVSFWLEWSE